MKWSIRAARRTLPYSASRWDIRIREKSIEGHVLRNIWHFSLARVPRKEVILVAKIYLGKDINFFMASQNKSQLTLSLSFFKENGRSRISRSIHFV